MNKEPLNPEYWNSCYHNNRDICSLNSPNPVLVHVIEQKILAPPGKLLVAGCGKGDDAFYLSKVDLI